MAAENQSLRNLSLFLGPLFFISTVILYDLSGFQRRWLSSWDPAHRTRIGGLALSLSDYYFLAAIFCGVCGVVYFVLGSVARRSLEILFGYSHLILSVGAIALAARYIRHVDPSGPLEPIPQSYFWVFVPAQAFFLLYILMGVFSSPPEE